MSPTTETCACGASITLGINDSTDIGWRLGEWRKGHRHDLDAAEACRERDEAVACATSAERDLIATRRALAQAEHERDEARHRIAELEGLLAMRGES